MCRLIYSLIVFVSYTISEQQVQVNHCVLRCKDNHMREMDNEWSTDFTLPLLSLLLATGNETAAYAKLKSICQSNDLMEECLSKCNRSQETAILLAGTKSWEDPCAHLDEVRTQFSCWKNHGSELSQACRPQTLHLKDSLLQFTKNQTEYFIQSICTDFDKFSTCYTQEHGRLCGLKSELIAGRMFHSNREAIFNMLKIRWSTLPSQCGYSQLRRDTYSHEKYSRLNSAGTSAILVTCITLLSTAII